MKTRAYLIPFVSSVTLITGAALSHASAKDLTAMPLPDGGYAVESAGDMAEKIEARGLLVGASVGDLVDTIYVNNTAGPTTSGVQLTGRFKVTVGREDGSLKYYPDAGNLTAFTDEEIDLASVGIAVFDGAVVFDMANAERGEPQRRLDHGTITLTPIKPGEDF
ncbi:MAG: hypothetical protein AAFY84_14950 [Pseudomonadota bacterium]